jgi:hypothetical protein
MKKVIIITYGNYPNGEAASVRIHCISKLIEMCGFEPIIISMSRIKPFEWNTFNSIKFISIRTEKSGLFSKILNYLSIAELSFKIKTVSALCCYETANKAFKLIFTPYNGTNLGMTLPSA